MEWICALFGVLIFGGAIVRALAGSAPQRIPEQNVTITFERGVYGYVMPEDATFVTAPDPIDVLGRMCPRPMFWMTRRGGKNTPPSFIDVSLPVNKTARGPAPEMEYWPSYSQMTPAMRSHYLGWLSGGRVATDIPEGYVFVFFYGLERRLIFGDDRELIRGELRRLLTQYPDFGSLQGYGSRLLNFTAIRDLDVLDERALEQEFALVNQWGGIDELALRAVLTWFGRNKRPLPWTIAKLVARFDPRSPGSVVTMRTAEQFDALFQERYQSAFGDGLRLQYVGNRSNVQYRPASMMFADELERNGASHLVSVSLNDPLSRRDQFDELLELYRVCVDELRSFSRAVGKLNTEELTPEAWEKLPAELKELTPHPNEDKWLRLVSESLRDDGWAHVNAAALCEVCGQTNKRKYSRDECRDVASMASSMGFGVEPDPRVLPQSWKGDDEVVLFQLPDPDAHLEARTGFQSVMVALYLAMYVASADGVVDQRELKVIREHLTSTLHVSGQLQRRLEAASIALQGMKLNMRGVSDLVEEFVPEPRRPALGDLLIDVALADGRLDRDEETFIKRAYKAVGLDPSVGLERARELAELRLEDPTGYREKRIEMYGALTNT